MLSYKLSRAIKHALWMGTVATLASPYCSTAFAADAAEKDKDTSMDEVVVTGSLIRLPKNMTSTSPIQIVDSQEIKLSGKADISDLLNQMPQVFSNDLGQDLGNRTPGLSTAGGASTADLRGLGPNRTLVLVDGRRLGLGSPNTAISSPAPDLDQIPTALIDHIEVVTGGASAVYGSDAIAGVVNFVMKKNFQGIEADYQLGGNIHQNHSKYSQGLSSDAGYAPVTGTSHDGRNVNATLVAGTNFADDRGNVTAYLTYLKADPVTSGERDFGACQIGIGDDLSSASCTGSANSNYFRPRTGPTAGTAYSVSGNQFVDWGSVDTNPPAVFNSQKYIYMGRADTRYTAGFLAHVDINDYIKPYLDFNFMNDRSLTEVAPSALFRDANPFDSRGNYNINCSNPLLSAQEAAALCTPADIAADAASIASTGQSSKSANVRIGRRNVEGGGRQAYYEHTNFRGAVGFKGDFDAWNYDVYAQYYYTTFYNSNDKYLDYKAITNALQVTGTSSNPVCISGDPCVPYNIFSEGGVTPAQLEYLTLSGTAYGTETLRTTHADVSGDLGKYGAKLPTADDGIAVAFGYEHRAEKLTFKPDSGELSGSLAGFAGAAVAIDRGVAVTEEFAEIRVPLVQNKAFIKDLVFDTAFRHSDYSTTGGTNTYKFELQYAPTNDVRFRGSYQKAIRAPGLIELYNPPAVGQIAFTADPCAPTEDDNNNLVPASATLAQCARSGVTAPQYGNGGTTNFIPQGTAGQLTQLISGNPQLTPEIAKTYTIGFTFTPTVLPNFTGSVDYYHIALTNGIGTLPATLIMNQCLTTGNPYYCSQLVRSSDGGLTGASVANKGYIVQSSYNVAIGITSGIDVQGAYNLQLSPQWGALQFAFNGSYLMKQTSQPSKDSHMYDCAGLFGSTCQTVNSRWRHNLMITWKTPVDVAVSMKWRYMSSVSLDNNDSDPTLNGATFGAYNSFNARIPSYSYLDLSANWMINKTFTIRGGVNNILDKDPPIVTTEIVSGGAANTYGVYDALGRQWFLGVNAKF